MTLVEEETLLERLDSESGAVGPMAELYAEAATRIRELESLLTLERAEREGAGSTLLELQQECITAREEVTRMEKVCDSYADENQRLSDQRDAFRGQWEASERLLHGTTQRIRDQEGTIRETLRVLGTMAIALPDHEGQSALRHLLGTLQPAQLESLNALLSELRP